MSGVEIIAFVILLIALAMVAVHNAGLQAERRVRRIERDGLRQENERLQIELSNVKAHAPRL